MTKALFRETLRSIRHTKARFISIIAIVALGISFFAGIKAAYPDMHETAVRYYKNNNLMDIWMLSTIGFSDDDVAKINALDSVDSAVGSKFVDGAVKVNDKLISDTGGSQTICRVYGFDVNLAQKFQQGENNKNYINRLTLLEGRYPQKDGECLVDRNNVATPKSFVIGNTITVEGVEESLEKQLGVTKFKIVGVIETPRYVSIERGQTTVGSGSLSCFIYVPNSAFSSPFYSELCVKAKNVNSNEPYSEEYFNSLQGLMKKIEFISADCLEKTAVQVKSYYGSELESAKADYAKAEKEAQEKADEASAKLSAGQREIEQNEQKLDSATVAAQRQFSSKYQQLLSGESQYSSGLKEYNEKYSEYLQQKKRLDNAKSNFAPFQSLLPYMKSELEYSLSIKEKIKSIENQNAQLNSSVSALQGNIASGNSEIESLQAQIYEYQTNPGTDEEGMPIDRSGEIAQFQSRISSIESKIIEYQNAIESYQTSINENQAKIDELKADKKYNPNTDALRLRVESIEALESEVEKRESELNSAKAELDSAKKRLEKAGLEIDDGWDAYNRAYEQASAELEKNTRELNSAKSKLNASSEEFNKQYEEGRRKLDEAKYRIEESEKVLDAVVNNKAWYIYDRNALPGYEGYGQTSENMKAFAAVFPLFFFVVAALVCLTTMTRMVDEERTQLGTLKALGYTDSSIRKKYIFYSFFAAIIGSVIGLSIGLVLFPKAIFSAYSLMYNLPDIVILYPWRYMLSGTLFAVLSTTSVSYIACRKEMKTCPAQLMRPKAPKAGKRILLEKISFVWNHMNFTSKVTARNIFRNKKRFIMTLIGIAGCTALLLTGFGLSDSINAIIKTQYGKDGIIHADCQLAFKNSQPSDEPSEVYSDIVNNTNVKKAMMFYSKTVTGYSDNSDETFSVHFFVPQKKEMLGDFIKLQDRITKQKYALTDSGKSDDFGVVVSEKLAKKLGVSVGDEIKLKFSEEEKRAFKVSAIVENYTYHYVYISPERYEKVFGEAPSFNYAFVTYKDNIRNIENISQRNKVRDESAKTLMSYDVSAVIDIVNTSENFSRMFKSLDYVIMVFIISAALLAFVVLYNLTNININERKREIATLKVLGFHNYESTSYIGRENFIITILGTIFGLVAGFFLHRFVIEVAEVNVVMFGRTINLSSYLWSVLLTFAFSIIVSIVMSITIKRIHMVESLKSIE